MSSIGVEAIREAVEARAEEIIEWVQTLIRFPSENRYPDGRASAGICSRGVPPAGLGS